MVGGGLDFGTTNLVIGPSGSGKSTLVMQYLFAGLRSGEKALFVSFDETKRVFSRRSSGLGMNVAPFEEEGLFTPSGRWIRPNCPRANSVRSSANR